ncbi:hypothetical protein [Thiomonas bhubaneswarensis]|uniref:Uncharacterized protein n=1 Tax=Thiomonas bhubaneswarensis TaxID=339866 RepID=A0A0K6HS75_9BURK|nr:hypothetical protein [Thiomonas bhubaneswarensis]CUA93897.1 hypothetical protein Ga0061069_101403 [Thiomonas bhubaneswarensis]
MQDKPTYPGYHADTHGITQLGRVVLDAWVFGLLPETEDCKGWDLQRMQGLMQRVEAEWDQYGNLPSRLPPELAERHRAMYERAMKRAQDKGWNAELDDDD